MEEVERIKAICVEYKTDFVIALGGGQTIDVGKVRTLFAFYGARTNYAPVDRLRWPGN